MSKIDIEKLKTMITEAKNEQKWHNKFIKNFVDVRGNKKPMLSEQQLESMADHLYEILQKKS
tara:strand:- start:8062 stop:8247 length:186 start_codon:yes stop_codon:yes gene_type:complete